MASRLRALVRCQCQRASCIHKHTRDACWCKRSSAGNVIACAALLAPQASTSDLRNWPVAVRGCGALRCTAADILLPSDKDARTSHAGVLSDVAASCSRSRFAHLRDSRLGKQESSDRLGRRRDLLNKNPIEERDELTRLRHCELGTQAFRDNQERARRADGVLCVMSPLPYRAASQESLKIKRS